MSYINTGAATWNAYKSGVIRKDSAFVVEDVYVSDVNASNGWAHWWKTKPSTLHAMLLIIVFHYIITRIFTNYINGFRMHLAALVRWLEDRECVSPQEFSALLRSSVEMIAKYVLQSQK